MKLSGLKVIELSWFLPGPFLAMALADHGAEVIKVEPPGDGDPGRHIGPMDTRTSVFFRRAGSDVVRSPMVLRVAAMCAKDARTPEYAQASGTERFMADAHADPHHAPADPNAAPTHGDVRFSFSGGQMAVAWVLGTLAIVAGIVLGLTVTNT